MLKRLFGSLALALGLIAPVAMTNSANADVLLTVDLSVTNQITITATSGLAGASVNGSPFDGIYLADFYSAGGTGLIYTNGVGNLSTFLNASDNSPGLFRGSGDTGLNIWSFSSVGTANIIAGTQAFAGTATWSISAAEYADMIADGARTGDIYFPADTSDDLGGATLVGTYQVVVPAPGAFAMLGLGFAGVSRRRRR